MIIDDTELSALRRLAFSIAYRMLGSVHDAEDLAQEGLLRLQEALRRDFRIDSPRGYLSMIVSRLAIDHLRSAALRRETYIGDWFPEPLITSAGPDPAEAAETADSLSLAFLVLLEMLSPEQRAAFLLHDVFDEPYVRVAGVIGTSEQNARQLVSRARRSLEARRPRFETSEEKHRRLADRFFAAANSGDLGALEQLLAHDVELRSDGGGKAPNIARAVSGRSRVARLLTASISRTALPEGFHFRREQLNAQEGVLVLDQQERVAGVLILDIAGEQIRAVNSIVNPDKLQHLGPPTATAAWRGRPAGGAETTRPAADPLRRGPHRRSQEQGIEISAHADPRHDARAGFSPRSS